MIRDLRYISAWRNNLFLSQRQTGVLVSAILRLDALRRLQPNSSKEQKPVSDQRQELATLLQGNSGGQDKSMERDIQREAKAVQGSRGAGFGALRRRINKESKQVRGSLKLIMVLEATCAEERKAASLRKKRPCAAGQDQRDLLAM